MTLNETYQNVLNTVLKKSEYPKNIDTAVLSLHESATKIFQATANNQAEKINSRVAAALLSVFYVMRELGVTDPEKCLAQKIAELEK